MMYDKNELKRAQKQRGKYVVKQKEETDYTANAVEWIKLAVDHGSKRKSIFLMAGTIVCSFFPGLDENQFLYYRDSEPRLASHLTIVEILDPV